MKRISMIVAAFGLTMFFFGAQAQAPISKGVQKVANKKALEQEATQTKMTATSVPLPALVVSKSVQSIPNPALITTETQGNVKSEGTPAWVNAKGVHQMNNNAKQAEKVEIPADRLAKADN